ncbi:hypothetical protein MY11210_001087 [Beauveria gryllotalpidicola]
MTLESQHISDSGIAWTRSFWVSAYDVDRLFGLVFAENLKPTYKTSS